MIVNKNKKQGTTAATGFALLRENGGITAVSAAQRDAISASHAQTISILADDLIGRNASEALDDPIAIAAANQNAAAAVRDAWQNVSNLQARAAETFSGYCPGGFGMFTVGFIGSMNDQFDIAWASIVGMGQGVANAINGVQDALIAIPNIVPLGYNLFFGVFGAPTMPYIPSPDWSENLIVQNDPTHAASKFLGGQGLFTLLTLGLSQVTTLRS